LRDASTSSLEAAHEEGGVAHHSVVAGLAMIVGVATAAEAVELCVRWKEAAGEIRSGALVRARESCHENERRLAVSERHAAPMHPLWKDSQGRVVGTYSAGELLHESGGRVFRLQVDRFTGALTRGTYPPVLAFYESRDCTGPVLLRPVTNPVVNEAFVLAGSGMTAYYPAETGVPLAVHSFWDDVFFACYPAAITLPVAPPRALDLGAFQEPFALAME
jgi:hypothetical protein